MDFCSNCGPARELAARAGCREVSELAAAGPRGGPGPGLSLPAPGGVAARVGASLGATPRSQLPVCLGLYHQRLAAADLCPGGVGGSRLAACYSALSCLRVYMYV